MRLITLNRCKAGIELGKSIFNDEGKVLLSEGAILSDRLIEKLKEHHIFTIYVKDAASEGIEVAEPIPEALRVEATKAITEGFQDIVDLNAGRSNLKGMIKTGKAVQNFQKIFKDILNCLSENKQALNLLATTKVYDNYVYTHSLNVSIYSCQLALENGLPIKDIERIGLGAMLHDIGKMFISKEILNKPGKLTKEEFEQVKNHTEFGFDTLRKIHEIPLTVSHCALQHHERLDGSGYPRGIKENDIHNYAKILGVADVFDAVTSHRVYRPSMLPHEGLELLYAGNGTQFESKQVNLFKDCIAIYPPGLTVKLNDGKTGIVSKYNFNAAGRPVVRIISNEDSQAVSPYEIDLSVNENLTCGIVEAGALL